MCCFWVGFLIICAFMICAWVCAVELVCLLTVDCGDLLYLVVGLVCWLVCVLGYRFAFCGVRWLFVLAV